MYKDIQPCYCYSFQNLQSCVQQFTVLWFTAVYSDLQSCDLQHEIYICDTDQVDLIAAVFEDGNGLLVVHILQRDPVNTHHSVIYPVMYNDKHKTYTIILSYLRLHKSYGCVMQIQPAHYKFKSYAIMNKKYCS